MIILKDAQKVVEGCLKKAREENMNPITIAVLDTRGAVSYTHLTLPTIFRV